MYRFLTTGHDPEQIGIETFNNYHEKVKIVTRLTPPSNVPRDTYYGSNNVSRHGDDTFEISITTNNKVLLLFF